MTTIQFLAAILISGAPLAAPAQEKPLTFDVASVKPFVLPTSEPGRKTGGGGPTGPGTSDPGRIHRNAVRLKDLVIAAYNVKDFQIVGPSWLDSDDETTRFTIDATMPPDTTKEQLRIMWQNLLAERFKLTIHRETKELPKYSLLVAKNGPKMKKSAQVTPSKEDAPPPGARPKQVIDAYGFPIPRIPPEGGAASFFINGRGRLSGERATMQDVADKLTTWHLRTPVTDETGLKGRYDFILTYSIPDWHGEVLELPDGMGRVNPAVASETLPDLFGAVQSQLGLKLERNKGPVEVIVIDHIEKRPTDN